MDATQLAFCRDKLTDFISSGNPGAIPESQDVGHANEAVPSVYTGTRPGTARSQEPTSFRSVKRPGI